MRSVTVLEIFLVALIASPFICLVIAIFCILSGSHAGAPFHEINPAGFWPGLWHGLTAPVSFLFSLFNSDVEVYCRANVGGWYDFGFLLGAGAFAGSSSSSSSSRSRRDDD